MQKAVWKMNILILVAILVTIASVMAGLTSFGDAIMFHIMWAIAGAAGDVAKDRTSLSHAVLLCVIMGLASIPLQVYFAWGKLRLTLPYGIVASLTGSITVPIGASLLFYADLQGIKIFVGLLFFLFACGRLTASLIPPAPPLPPPVPPAVLEAGEAVLKPPAVLESVHSTSTAGSSSSNDDSAVRVSPSADWVIDTWPGRIPALVIQPISPKYGVKATLAIVAVTGLAAGLLGGLLAVAGPPLMICFSVLELDKDVIRAIKISYTLFEAPSRIGMFTSPASTFSIPVYGNQYLVTILFSLLGNVVGTWLRRFCDTARIVQILLCLVLLSSSILLGALDSPAVAAAFTIVVLLWCLLVLVLRTRPGVYHGGMAVMRAGLQAAWACMRQGRGGRGAAEQIP